jgi:hypothetical protein
MTASLIHVLACAARSDGTEPAASARCSAREEGDVYGNQARRIRGGSSPYFTGDRHQRGESGSLLGRPAFQSVLFARKRPRARIRRQAFSTLASAVLSVAELSRKQRASKVGLRRVIYVAGPTWRPGHGKATAAIADPFRHPSHITFCHVSSRSVTAGRSVTFASAGEIGQPTQARWAATTAAPPAALPRRFTGLGGHHAQNLGIGPGRADRAGTWVARRVHLAGRSSAPSCRS